MSLRYLGSVRNVCVDRYFQYFCWEERSCKWISDIKFALLHISYPRLSLSDERNKKIHPSLVTTDSHSPMRTLRCTLAGGMRAVALAV